MLSLKKPFIILFLTILLQACATNNPGVDAGDDHISEIPDEPKDDTGDESGEETTPVARYGQLQIEGGTLVDQQGDPVQLKGMSLFWSQWQPQFYNETTVKNLVDFWKIDIIRAAMAVEHEGYLQNPEEEMRKVQRVIDAAIEEEIYVIVDWHDHHAEDHLEESKKFFSEIAEKYGNHPNLIYEPYNEPLNVSWTDVLKPYHEAILSEIRKFDPDNVVVLGTPEWSQRVDLAAQDPVNDSNVAYTLHFYAGTHKEDLRNKALTAMQKGLAIFVTEYGTVNADGDGAVAVESMKDWYKFMDKHNLSWCNWSIADKDESSAAVLPGTTPKGLREENNISSSGSLVRSELLQRE
ncbi:glycoside hydrolase family 5 protein [Salinimicrobium sp. GXAS 041]|uniref:glycoside hydrolase family 5 protein n=1 Tax=Salinimicrobium sp. GXAS 041 TaxID=3400806 RepID=UPI003C766BB5